MRAAAAKRAGKGDAASRQPFANLIENAINHATGATRIELDIERRQDIIELAVRDNGCGIPAAMRLKRELSPLAPSPLAPAPWRPAVFGVGATWTVG
jgi:hypothetical protein